MTTKIDYQGIHIEGQLIAPDTPEWHEWLAAAKSFRFEMNHEAWIDGKVPTVETLTFSGVKLKQGYWQAHKKVDGTLRREHLGKIPTYAKLKEVAVLINSDSYWHQKRRSPKSMPPESHNNSETVSEHSSQNADEIAKLKAELEQVKAERESMAQLLVDSNKAHAEELTKVYAELERMKVELEEYSSRPQARSMSAGEISLEVVSDIIHSKNWKSKIDQHRQYPTKNVRYWALVQVLDELKSR